MKTYITILTLSIIIFYVHFSDFEEVRPGNEPNLPQQEVIKEEKTEMNEPKKESHDEVVNHSQQKPTPQQDSQSKVSQKINQKNSSQTSVEQEQNQKEVIYEEIQRELEDNDHNPDLKVTEEPIFINEALIRSEFIQLINTTRATPVTVYNPLLESSNLRAQEASIKWSHTRPNGSRWDTVLKNIIDISTIPHGENLAQTQITYKENYNDSEIIQMVNTLHQGLVHSPTHYAVMTNENYKKVNIGIHIEKKDSCLFITIAQHYIN